MSDEFQKRAERAILEGTNKIMMEAQKKIALEKAGKSELGKWKVTLFGSVERSSYELKEFFDHLKIISEETEKRFPTFRFEIESISDKKTVY